MNTNLPTTSRDLIAEIKAGVANVTSGEDWLRLLRLKGAMHNYSFNNLMLISMQAPEATYVAGYSTWQRLGRQVRTGERGIRILAPVFRRKGQASIRSEEDGPGGIVGCRVTRVFDISQTDGEEGPKLTRLLEGHEQAALLAWVALSDFAENELRIPVSVEPIDSSVNGYLSLLERRIVVKEANSPLQKVKTLAHEIGHALLHMDETDTHSRPEMEVEAESVAYCVLSGLGLDTGSYTFGYVAGWSNGDPELVQRSAERIMRASSQVLSSVTGEHQRQGPMESPQ